MKQLAALGHVEVAMRIVKQRGRRSSVILYGEAIVGGFANRVRVYDLSDKGAQIELSTSAAPGDKLLFSCKTPEYVAATIVWVRGKHCGITFDTPVSLI